METRDAPISNKKTQKKKTLKIIISEKLKNNKVEPYLRSTNNQENNNIASSFRVIYKNLQSL